MNLKKISNSKPKLEGVKKKLHDFETLCSARMCDRTTHSPSVDGSFRNHFKSFNVLNQPLNRQMRSRCFETNYITRVTLMKTCINYHYCILNRNWLKRRRLKYVRLITDHGLERGNAN